MSRFLEAICLCLILLLAAFLRLYHVRTNPAWFTDEATHMDIAHHVLDGKWQYMAVTDSVLYFARPPLFEIVLACLHYLFGYDILILRVFTGVLGVTTVGLLWMATRRLSHNPRLALLAAAALAIYPQATLYSRFGFSYNLLAPLTPLVLLGLGEYWQRGARFWLVFAALSIGIGGISDLMMFSFTLPFFIVVIMRRRRDMWQGMFFILLPFVIYTLWMLASVPDAFVFDLRYTAARLGGVPLQQQLWNTTYNYTVLLSDGFWIFGGIIGMFVMLPCWLGRMVALLFLTPVFLLGRIVPLYSLSFYYLIPLLPLAALGMAALVFRAVPLVLEAIKHGLPNGKIHLKPKGITGLAYALTLLIVGAPFVVTTDLDRQYVQGHWPTAIDPFLISPVDADRVADYLNTHVLPDDIIVASPPLAWQVKTSTVDFVMCAAAIEGDTVHWGDSQSLPLRRLCCNPHYTQARFVVVDNFWRAWGIPNAPGIDAVLAEVMQWPLVFRSGEIEVYENPARASENVEQ